MATDWAPTATAVAGLVSDRNLTDGEFSSSTVPTLAWVEGRVVSVAATVEYLATTAQAEAVAAEYVLYQVAADVDAGWNAGRTIDTYTRSTEYRRRAAALLAQLTGDGDGGTGGTVSGSRSPVWGFPDATTVDGEVW